MAYGNGRAILKYCSGLSRGKFPQNPAHPRDTASIDDMQAHLEYSSSIDASHNTIAWLPFEVTPPYKRLATGMKEISSAAPCPPPTDSISSTVAKQLSLESGGTNDLRKR
jgi:hypothetical protein